MFFYPLDFTLVVGPPDDQSTYSDRIKEFTTSGD